jgi:hypothetical protein
MTSLAVSPVSEASQSPQNNQMAINLWEKRFEKRHFSSDPVIAKLDVECNELAQTWKKFQEHLPQQDQVGFDERLQEFRDVSAMIGNLQNVWMSTPRQRVFDRSMALCDQFISSVHLHLVLLSALPRNEAYITLFHGVLQSVIKVRFLYQNFLVSLSKSD